MKSPVANRVTTIVLLVVALISDVVLFVPALMLAMASDGCSTSCNMVVFGLGYYLAVAGPILVTLTGIVFSIIKMVKKQDAITTALIGIGGTYGAFVLGLAIVFITVTLAQG
ncbi:putative membrane protein [Aurantimicrobium minutum]|uniref:hypothetical protein n=1 Tax=Aurantimicrobium minutum TaxID=708131 RepID=UPI0024739A38|nr:hypothetical protein [Aurantimicrobium minutum]MDH6532033.1 putative membrane protein [Aurantimicrobium minutum]